MQCEGQNNYDNVTSLQELVMYVKKREASSHGIEAMQARSSSLNSKLQPGKTRCDVSFVYVPLSC